MKRAIVRHAIGRVFAVALGISTLCAAPPASARWLKATSENFIVYGEGSEKSLRSYVGKLESYHALLELVTGLRARTKGAPATIYLVARKEQLKIAFGRDPKNVGGFYSATAGATAAISGRGDDWQPSEEILFHEYAHHFMFRHSALPYPPWYVEGFAEYVGTTEFKNDKVVLGGVPLSRAVSLIYGSSIPWKTLVTARSLAGMKGEAVAAFYAQSWLLTHYLFSDDARTEKLQKYLRAYVVEGKSDWTAFVEAFGLDEKALQSEIKQYQSRVIKRGIAAPPAQSDTVTIEAMPASADQLLLPKLRADLQAPGVIEAVEEEPEAETGENKDTKSPAPAAEKVSQDQQMLARVRQKAAEYPGDAFAAKALASTEISFGDPNAGVAALEAVALNVRDAEWQYLSGLARLALARKDEAKQDALLPEARRFFGASFKLDPDRYETLYAYYQSFEMEGQAITPSILDVLLRAHALAPQVWDISGDSAVQLLNAGRGREAALILGVLVNQPHLSEGYRSYIADLLQRARQVAAQEAVKDAAGKAAQ